MVDVLAQGVVKLFVGDVDVVKVVGVVNLL